MLLNRVEQFASSLRIGIDARGRRRGPPEATRQRGRESLLAHHGGCSFQAGQASEGHLSLA